jgi:hypothetical protein
MSTEPGITPWIPTDETFGARLALIRQRVGWGNVTAAAVACDITVSSWRAWERDNVLPKAYLSTCQRIAEVTGCDLAWLVGVPPLGTPHTGGIALPNLRRDGAAGGDHSSPPDDAPGISPRMSRDARSRIAASV